MKEILFNIFLTLLSMGLLVGLKALLEYTKEASEGVKSEKAKKAIEKALEVVTLAVNTTNQTFVQSLKDEGTFDKDRAEEAFNATKVEILKMLDEETKEVLEQEFKSTDVFLNSAIESKIWEDKKTK